jgi:hypothetical protein
MTLHSYTGVLYLVLACTLGYFGALLIVGLPARYWGLAAGIWLLAASIILLLGWFAGTGDRR